MHSDFITDINDAIVLVLDSNRFQRANIVGLAELVNNGEEGTIPMVVGDDGSGTIVAVDDTYNLQIYHRHLSSTYTEEADESFGSGVNEVTEVAKMKLVLIADRERIEQSKSDLVTHVAMGFPANFTDTDTGAYTYVSMVRAVVTDSNLDNAEVYSGEYGLDGQLPANYVMASIDYDLYIEINKNCYDSCT